MRQYLKMADVFDCEVESDADLMFSDSLGNIADFSGYKTQCRYSAHAINSHDELVQMSQELLEVISRMVSRADEFKEMLPTSDWSDGYRRCVIDTSKALKEILGKIEGCAV